MTDHDIRDQNGLTGREVRQLNFIGASRTFEFRKYYRAGLRSHIFEVLLSEDVARELNGVLEDGIRMFPRAVPCKMFRIFRHRFASKEEIFHEIKRYKMLLHHLGPELIAQSEEFIADYRASEASGILLCGLQEYVRGEILDPWRLAGQRSIETLLCTMPHDAPLRNRLRTAIANIRTFTRGVRSLISAEGVIPDLAGVGNLILTPAGGIKLVDINNIVRLRLDDTIHLDDKGYPASDVSVQVLFILERELLGRRGVPEDPLFRTLLTPERQARVRKIEQEFYKTLR